ncbi:MAG: carbohydrate-binding family 9-like protein [Acidobacteriota bacterium]
MKKKYGCPKSDLARYTALYTEEPLKPDARLDNPVWQRVVKSQPFVDMVSGIPGFLETRMAALWDKNYFYVGFWIQEPNVKAELTERDSYVYNENDVEVFIEGEDCYYEFQINALGTIYEVFYIWQDALKPGSRFDTGEFDLMSRNVDVLGGFQDITRNGKHPRGKRWAFMDWDLPGLKTDVYVDGKINKPEVIDKGWKAMLAIPWEGMKILAGKRNLPPKDGDCWRMDFSRFEKLEYNGVKAEPHPGWSLNKHGVYDSHIPECFSIVHFSEQKV